MQVFDGLYDLHIELCSLLLVEFALLDDLLEEFTSTHVFHDEIDLRLRFKDLKQLYDIGVADFAEDVYFSLDACEISIIFNARFL